MNRGDDLSDEIREHLREKVEELVAGGMPPGDAEFAARRVFGNVALVEEASREVWGWPALESLAADLRYGLRVLAKNPGFTAVAVLTLTLGIGATAAIFSVVDAVLLRPLPYRDANRLVWLYEDQSRSGIPRDEFTPANYVDCQAQTGIFEDVAAVDADRFYNLAGEGTAPERIMGEGVSQNLFSMLGVQPLLGRTFFAEEDAPGRDHEVLLSHRLWQGRFGGDSGWVGRNIFLNGEKYLVVGVMPAQFSFPNKNADVWVPTGYSKQQLADRGSHFLTVIARLRQGVSVKKANAALLVFSQSLRRAHMDSMRFVEGFVADPLAEVYTRESRAGLVVLLGAVAFILLIACANIANLLLSRAAVRRREMALRLALGARRRRIVRQLLTESAVLAAAGGLLGILAAEASFRFLAHLIPEDLSRTVSIGLNFPVLGFAILISLASAFLFGLAPALRISKIDVNDALKEGGRGGTGGGRKFLGDALVAGEIALSLLLLVTSSLLLESFTKLRGVDPGFQSDHILSAQMDVPETRYQNFVQRTQFFQAVLERIRGLAGVRSAGLTSVLPLTWKSGMAGFVPEGALRREVQYGALDRVVSAGYFEAMRIPLLRGRLFEERDGPDAPLVAIVNQTMAKKFWPNEDALGKGFRFDGNARRIQIVGIVGNVRQVGLNEPPKEEMYFPYWQAQGNYMVPQTMVLRTAEDPVQLAGAMREAVWSIDPNQPVSDIMTMDDVLDKEVAQRRVQAFLLGGLAALALMLACVGIYGVMAYLVAQQKQEIGIRMALGAHPGDILGLILGRGAKLTLAGVGFGLAAAVLATRLMQSLLFEVSPMDPLTFAGVAILLTAVALAACYIPARRAMRVDPLMALRHE